MESGSKIKKDLSYLKQSVEKIRIAMLTAENQENVLKSRPMTTLKMGDENDIWFFIDDKAFVVDELTRREKVNLSYVDPIREVYISVSGLAEKIDDDDQKKALWKPTFETWFPGGLANPDLRLLRIVIQQAEYWNTHSNEMNLLYKVTDSILSGKQYIPGEHGEFSTSTKPN